MTKKEHFQKIAVTAAWVQKHTSRGIDQRYDKINKMKNHSDQFSALKRLNKQFWNIDRMNRKKFSRRDFRKLDNSKNTFTKIKEWFKKS